MTIVETFGDVIIRILYTIISGIINTSVAVISDVLLLFNTVARNAGSLSVVGIAIAVILLAVLIFGLAML